MTPEACSCKGRPIPSSELHGAFLLNPSSCCHSNHLGNCVPLESLATMPLKVKNVLLNLHWTVRKIHLFGNVAHCSWSPPPHLSEGLSRKGHPLLTDATTELCGQRPRRSSSDAVARAWSLRPRSSRIESWACYFGTGELRLVNLIYLGLSFPVCKMDIIIPTSQAYYKNQMKMD